MNNKILISLLAGTIIFTGCKDKDITQDNIENEGQIEENIDMGYKIKEIKSEKLDLNLTYLPSVEEEDLKLEKIIKEYLDADIKEVGEIRYFYHPVSLTEDNENLVFVYLLGDYVGGTGGSLAIIVDTDKEEVFSEFSLVNNPIIISEEKTNGYNDIIMISSGGGSDYKLVKMKYDGEKYPSNPSLEEEIVEGHIDGFAIISEEIEYQEGHLLK